MESQPAHKDSDLPPFIGEKHAVYCKNLDSTTDSDAIGHFTNEHLKVSAGYWCMGALSLISQPSWERKDEIVSFLKACQSECGGVGGNVGHDPHITNTLYALLILAMFDDVGALNLEKLVEYIASLQNEDGSFCGDHGGEIDARFSYCAVSALSLLNRLDRINKEKARDFILRCKNMDGSFGGVPDAESHAAYAFCTVGALKILGEVDLIDKDKLGLWLSRRQTLQGGFNGRPEKLPDVCYSWWILSTCFMLDRQDWIDFEALKGYVLRCQDVEEDQETGGIADRPGNEVDVFHTFFGLAALSLMGYYDLKKIDHVYALPVETMQKNFPHLYPKTS